VNEDWVGTEQITGEDRAYRGSRFAEVREALFANPYQRVWGAPDEPALPVYDVTTSRLLRGVLPFGRPYIFKQAVERALDSGADLRWGPDRKGFRRVFHPNGVCLIGRWRINQDSLYSGYFRKGSEALIVARYSVCCEETRRGHTRSLALVGKLFPTTDAQHAEPLRTANFITQEDIAGAYTDFINDAELRNAPDTTLIRRGAGMPVLMIAGAVFGIVDKVATARQVYPVAELGKPDSEPTRSPDFMRLLVAPEQPRIEGQNLDFRDEVMAQIYDKGDPRPKRTLTFNIEVTDDGTSRGPAFHLRRTFANWRRIGTITFTEAVVSYNGDCVIHFTHPTWRDDRNDPATATRQNGRKVHR